jgi:hypothetical protein
MMAGFIVCFIFARKEGYWVVTAPFLPLTPWMIHKVHKMSQPELVRRLLACL